MSYPFTDHCERHAGVRETADASMSKCVHPVSAWKLDLQLFQDGFQLPFQHAIQAQRRTTIGMLHQAAFASVQVLFDLGHDQGINGHMTNLAVLGCAFHALKNGAADCNDPILEVHIFNTQRKQLTGPSAPASGDRE